MFSLVRLYFSGSFGDKTCAVSIRRNVVPPVLVSSDFNSGSNLQFDEEIMRRQEALAQLLKKEEKINELEALLQAFRSQVVV